MGTSREGSNSHPERRPSGVQMEGGKGFNDNSREQLLGPPASSGSTHAQPKIVYAAVSHYTHDMSVTMTTSCYPEPDERAQKVGIPNAVQRMAEKILKEPSTGSRSSDAQFGERDVKIHMYQAGDEAAGQVSEYVYICVEDRGTVDCKALAVTAVIDRRFSKKTAVGFVQAVMDDHMLTKVVFNVETDRRLREDQLRSIGVLYNTNPPRSGKAAELDAMMNKVKGGLIQNIELAIGRHAAIEIMEEETKSLKDISKTFQEGSRRLRVQAWWKNMRMYGIIGAVVLVLILILLLVLCNPDFSKCGNHD